MGTRGFVGFVVNGEEKIGYNHFDSYPDHLGVQVLAAVRRHMDSDPAAFRRAVAALEVVPDSEDAGPSVEQLEHLRTLGFVDTSVGGPSRHVTWYQALRNTQGDVDAILAAGYIEDAHNFPLDSLFAEWGYFVDLDGDGTFEVYQGFQQEPHARGRFSDRGDGRPSYPGGPTYQPVALVASYPLAALPSETAFLADLAEREDA